MSRCVYSGISANSAFADPFDRDDLRRSDLADRQLTGALGLPGDMDGAGPAKPGAAAELRAYQAQLVAQAPEQRHLWRSVDRWARRVRNRNDRLGRSKHGRRAQRPPAPSTWKIRRNSCSAGWRAPALARLPSPPTRKAAPRRGRRVRKTGVLKAVPLAGHSCFVRRESAFELPQAGLQTCSTRSRRCFSRQVHSRPAPPD